MLFDLKAMCYGLVIYSVIATYLNTYYTDKILGYSFFQQIKSIFPYFLISLIILGETLLMSALIPNSLGSLLVSFLLGTITYLSLSWLFRLYAFGEAMDLLQSKLRRA